MTPASSLRAIRLLHTVVWAFFASIIVAIPVYAWRDRFTVVLVLAVIAFVEVGILAANGMRCPLTAVAARYTDRREPNFDIYLPMLVARYNKQIFGSILVAGLVLAAVRWMVS